MPFSNPTDPTFPPVALTPPFFIWRDWCMGDSLAYINANTQYLDTTIIAVSSNLKTTFDNLSSVFPIGPSFIQSNAILTDKIINGAVTVDKIATNAVTTVKIFDSAVTEQKIASNSISNIKLQDASINAQKIQNNSITTDKIIDRAVTSAKLADNIITTTKIADGSISPIKLVVGVPGNWWDKVVIVKPDGGTEIGRYLDFHNSNTDFSDYTFRIDNDINNRLTFSGNVVLQGTLAVNTGDILCRNNDDTGAIYFNALRTRSLSYNGARYVLANTGLDVLGGSVATNYLYVSRGGGDEGGQIELQNPATNTAIGNIILDTFQNRYRIFENVGLFRGFYLDLTEGTSGAASKIWHDNNTTNAITTTKIADNAVTTSKVVNSSITTDKIANNAVTTNKILDLNVTTGKLADNVILTGKIGDSAVTTAKIADTAVTTNKVADAAVTTTKIADTAVTTNKINELAVTTNKIAETAITTNKIADSAVTTNKVADSAVTTNKINELAVTTSKVAELAVTTNKIADSAVTTAKIASEAVTNNKLPNNVITTNKIADAAVTNAKIANDSIDINKIILSAPGIRWNVPTTIFGNGVMEIGRYIDFHNTSNDTNDFTYRIDNNAFNSLNFSGDINLIGTIITQGRTRPPGWGGGIQTFDVYADGGTIGIGEGGSLRCYIENSGQITINNNAPTIYFQDTNGRSAMLHCNSDRFYILRSVADNSRTWSGGPYPLEITLDNQNAYFGSSIFAYANGAHKKVATEEYVNTVTDGGQSLVPPGAVMTFARPSIPAGWLSCNGGAYNTYTYRELHQVISNIYGGTPFQNGVTNIPGATTTFLVPNLENQFVRGLGPGRSIGSHQGPQVGFNDYFTTTDDGDNQDNRADRRGELNGFWVNGVQVGYGNTAHSRNRHWGPYRVYTHPDDTRPTNIALRYCIKF
jgi:hypothetical protein